MANNKKLMFGTVIILLLHSLTGCNNQRAITSDWELKPPQQALSANVSDEVLYNYDIEGTEARYATDRRYRWYYCRHGYHSGCRYKSYYVPYRYRKHCCW